MQTRAHTHLRRREKLSALTNRLRRESRKITGPRKAILDLLRKHHHPLTNREILAALPGEPVRFGHHLSGDALAPGTGRGATV